jgi:thiol-disulfide isomerase/thioredoxin
MRIIKLTLIFLFLVTSYIQVLAQDDKKSYPEEGKQIMDYTFTDVMNYPDKTCKISNFRGKWLVLDFWTRWCGGCIASFPKMDAIDQQFRGKAKVLMVGSYANSNNKEGVSDEKLTKTIFELKRRRYNLNFSVVFDSLVANTFSLDGVPAIFIINPEGKIVAKTYEIDSSLLAEFINGRRPAYAYNYSVDEPLPFHGYNFKYPVLTNGQSSNGGFDNDFLCRSMIANWNPKMYPSYIHGFDGKDDLGQGCAEALGMDLPTLIKIAYTGRAYWSSNDDSVYTTTSRKLILKLKDTLRFGTLNARTNQNNYAYSISFPGRKTNPQFIRRWLLQDLERYFNFKSQIENCDADVYVLRVTDLKKVMKLESKGGKPLCKEVSDRPGFIFTNWPFKKFARHFGLDMGISPRYHNDYNLMPPLIDETGLDFNMDLIFIADLRDLDEVNEALMKNGLEIVKGKRKLKCIVITDTYL